MTAGEPGTATDVPPAYLALREDAVAALEAWHAPDPGQERWRREFREGPGNAFPGLGKKRWDDNQQAKLERKIGQQTLEIDFLKGCLQRIEEQRMLQALTGKPRSTGTSKGKSGRKRP